MKKLIVLFALFIFMSCEKEEEEQICWLCSIQNFVKVPMATPDYPNAFSFEWQDGGIEKFCDEEPQSIKNEVIYDCIIL